MDVIEDLSAAQILEEVKSTWKLRRSGASWIRKINHICILCLYLIFLLCTFLNFYVLLTRADALFQLRLYHATVGLLMFACSIVQLEFFYRTRHLDKLDEPHEMPLPALVGAIALTVGIFLGYLYFIVFNYAFENCDKLVDRFRHNELLLDTFYNIIMAFFSVISLAYIMHRRYYGAINSSLDKVCRLFINITFVIVWMKVVLYKGYLSHQELCQRKELDGYWCPAMKKVYTCDPSHDLHGTQKMWYYINKGLLSTSIISCASEYFPVLLVSHWLACGGAEEKASHIHEKQKKQQGIRGLMRDFIKDASRIYVTTYKLDLPPLKPSNFYILSIRLLVPPTCAIAIARWLAFFYYAIDFDELVAEQWITSDILGAITALLTTVFYAIFHAFSRTLDQARLDAHHKAASRGDVGLLFGCCIVLAIKFALQTIELVFQGIDGFLDGEDVAARIATLALTHIGQWLEYLALRRLLSLSTRDLIACKRFMPLAAVGGVLFSWVHFGCVYFDTTLIKYQLTDESFRYSEVTLISMLFTQTIYPAEYLYAFTASGCFLELLQRYMHVGYFQLGSPRIVIEKRESVFELLTAPRDDRRFAAGENIATIIEHARRLERARLRTESVLEAGMETGPENGRTRNDSHFYLELPS